MNELNPGSGPTPLSGTTPAVVRGLDHKCWKCDEATTCVIAVHAEGARQSDDWVWFEEKHALVFARDLLVEAGQVQLAATIKDRFSKTVGDSYLPNGCQHCDAIQGDRPLGEKVSGHGYGTPLEELPVLATHAVTVTGWRDILAEQSISRCGYPMSWADVE